MTTLRQLREALAKVDPSMDDRPVLIWTPGLYVELAGPTGQLCVLTTNRARSTMIEGSVMGHTLEEAAREIELREELIGG